MKAYRTILHAPPATLRGTRDYVHSTDLYEEILAGAAGAGIAIAGPIDLRITGKITRQPVYRFQAAEGADVSRTAAICRFRWREESWICAVAERGEPVTARKPYDESPAARLGQIDDRMIAIASETGMRPIEAVTALGVVLHKTALPPPAGERWMLAQLTLRRPLQASDTRKLTVAIERIVGQRMTRSSLAAEDGPLGTMTFILSGGANP